MYSKGTELISTWISPRVTGPEGVEWLKQPLDMSSKAFTSSMITGGMCFHKWPYNLQTQNSCLQNPVSKAAKPRAYRLLGWKVDA